MAMAASSLGELGKVSDYVETYTPSLLHSLPRTAAREKMGISTDRMLGEDVWTGYEFSWLTERGKPAVAGIRLRVPAHSPMLVESKSMKLYLMSFAQTRFDSRADVLRTLDQDLATAFRAPVLVELLDFVQLGGIAQQMPGRCLDDLDVLITRYEHAPDLLQLAGSEVQVRETLHTHLFRSLCPVTGQPDWASISVDYVGPAIDESSLLQYLISFRSHTGFHEATIELIFADILQRCSPQQLTVYGRFQRRGGLDINPFRSTHENAAPVYRLARQ